MTKPLRRLPASKAFPSAFPDDQGLWPSRARELDLSGTGVATLGKPVNHKPWVPAGDDERQMLVEVLAYGKPGKHLESVQAGMCPPPTPGRVEPCARPGIYVTLASDTRQLIGSADFFLPLRDAAQVPAAQALVANEIAPLVGGGKGSIAQLLPLVQRLLQGYVADAPSSDKVPEKLRRARSMLRR